MRKKKYIVNCPCSGKQLCKVSDGSEIEFDDSNSSYNIKIPADLIKGDIVIEINLVVIY